MEKKSLVVLAILLTLAFSASLAMAANQPSGRDVKSAPAVGTPAQDVQRAPAVGTPTPNSPPAPNGNRYHNGQYYPGWGCGYYPSNAGVSGGPYYTGSGNGYGCCW